MESKKIVLTVITVFTIILITATLSFAFFRYMKIGTKKISITAGDIVFSYSDQNNITITNSFPVADSIGAKDKNNDYNFRVSYKGNSKVLYDIYLISNNGTDKVFLNNQIKFVLLKNNIYVADTNENKGRKLSELEGFLENSNSGNGKILENNEITNNQIDNYILRIWISDDVDYTNTIDENKTSTGKYNGYTYSLKVKVMTS